MKRHASLSVLLQCQTEEGAVGRFVAYLRSMPHLELAVARAVPESLIGIDVLMSLAAISTEEERRLEPFVRSGGAWLALLPETQTDLSSLFGVRPGPVGPAAELRVIFRDTEHPAAVRLPDAIYLSETYRPLEITSDDTEVILYADWHYRHSPVLVHRRIGEGSTACTTLRSLDNPAFQQVLYRLLLHLLGRSSSGSDLGVALLGYAPSVGRYHGLGVLNTPGLTLRTACDLSHERLAQAQEDFQGLATTTSARDLAEDPDVDLVIVSTPPNSHARLCLEMMAAGKHVLCEKPLALNRRETDALAEAACQQAVHLSCHQNRRWDSDYLAILQAVREGRIGALFYMETFVGGFSHPCGYWHSDVEVSGGMAYDWGGHYLDWVVSLIPERVTAVIGTRHKRIWHDVTNADQERVQVRFAGGQEAEFLHSDIAAARKPKWYLLGTGGSIVGHWRDVAVYDVDPVRYYRRHEIPATEMTPELTLFRRHDSGQIVEEKLAVPAPRLFSFHRNLADHLLTGEPIVAPLEDSVRAVTILEAASRSAAKGGTLEVIDA